MFENPNFSRPPTVTILISSINSSPTSLFLPSKTRYSVGETLMPLMEGPDLDGAGRVGGVEATWAGAMDDGSVVEDFVEYGFKFQSEV